MMQGIIVELSASSLTLHDSPAEAGAENQAFQ